MNDPDSASHHDFFGVVPASPEQSDTGPSSTGPSDTDVLGVEQAETKPSTPPPSAAAASPNFASYGAETRLPPIVPPQQLRFSAPSRPRPHLEGPGTAFSGPTLARQSDHGQGASPRHNDAIDDPITGPDAVEHTAAHPAKSGHPDTSERPADRPHDEALPAASGQPCHPHEQQPHAQQPHEQQPLPLPTQVIPSWVVSNSPHVPEQPTGPQTHFSPPPSPVQDDAGEGGAGDGGAVPAFVSAGPTRDTTHADPPLAAPPRPHQLHADLPPPHFEQAEPDPIPSRSTSTENPTTQALPAQPRPTVPAIQSPAAPQLPGGDAAPDRLPTAQRPQPADNSPRESSQPLQGPTPGPGPHQPTQAGHTAPDVPFGTPPTAASSNRQGDNPVTSRPPNTGSNTDRTGQNTVVDDTDGLAVVHDTPPNIGGTPPKNSTKVAPNPADVAAEQLLSPLHDTVNYDENFVAEPAVSSDEPHEASTEESAKTKPSRPAWLELLREVGIVVGAALLISLTIKTFLFQMFYIPSPSMSTTLAIGDRVVVSQLTPGVTDLKRGDIIVFKDPGNWLPPKTSQPEGPWTKATTSVLTFVGILPNDNGQHLIKRIVGMPGDVVTCCDADGKIQINGEPIDEPYLSAGSMPSEVAFEIHVPKDRYWVLGDNRQHSKDSRYNMDQQGFGTVPHSEVVGRAVMIAWPAGRWTWLGNYSDTWARVPKPTNTPATAKTTGPDQGAEQKP